MAKNIIYRIVKNVTFAFAVPYFLVAAEVKRLREWIEERSN